MSTIVDSDRGLIVNGRPALAQPRPDRLRRHLRAAGFGPIAADLPGYLVANPPPSERSHAGITLRFLLTPTGQLEAWCDTDNGPVKVADEVAGYVTRAELTAPPARMDQLVVRVPRDLLDAVDRYVVGTRLTRSAVLRRALGEYLERRGQRTRS